MTRWCTSYASLAGKTVIVTGANTGIGYYAALDFAKRGGRVILACRDRQRAETAQQKIIEATGNENVVVKIIDLASFASVRAFADDINATEDRLDILVNNAGLVTVNIENKTTEDNLELTMQVNYFSSFLLTLLLIDLLKKSAPSRIINVSSEGAKMGKMDPNKLGEFKGVYKSYFNSKLGNIMFTQELARRLQDTGVTAYSLHPGVVDTEIAKRYTGFTKCLVGFAANTVMKTGEEGAQTTIYTSVEKGIEKYNGEHFVDCKRVSPYKTARNKEVAKKVWDATEVLVKLRGDEIKI